MRGGAECSSGPLRGSLLAQDEEHLREKQKDTSSKANNISRGAFYEGCNIISNVAAMLRARGKPSSSEQA
jgi:hypothetical protein